MSLAFSHLLKSLIPIIKFFYTDIESAFGNWSMSRRMTLSFGMPVERPDTVTWAILNDSKPCPISKNASRFPAEI